MNGFHVSAFGSHSANKYKRNKLIQLATHRGEHSLFRSISVSVSWMFPLKTARLTYCTLKTYLLTTCNDQSANSQQPAASNQQSEVRSQKSEARGQVHHLEDAVQLTTTPALYCRISTRCHRVTRCTLTCLSLLCNEEKEWKCSGKNHHAGWFRFAIYLVCCYQDKYNSERCIRISTISRYVHLLSGLQVHFVLIYHFSAKFVCFFVLMELLYASGKFADIECPVVKKAYQ